jgi:hypothetical protein
MCDDLFFIPIISRALQQQDSRAALREAFEKIKTIGRSPQHSRGYEQFLRFMDEISPQDREEMSELTWKHILEALERRPAIEILIERKNHLVGSCLFEDFTGRQNVSGIKPGSYQLKLDTGRIIWKGHLTEKDLLWTKAFPGQPLEVAADTGESGSRPTRTVDLPESGVVLRFYAGVESGSMEIEVAKAEPDQR